MEAICSAPREIERRRPSKTDDRAGPGARGALPFAAALLLGLGLSGCNITFPPGEGDCPSLADMCPNLECENGFLVSDEGCALCECAAPEPEPHPVRCSSDADCRQGEMCLYGAVSPSGPRDAGPMPTEPRDAGSPEPSVDAGSSEPSPGQDAGPAPVFDGGTEEGGGDQDGGAAPEPPAEDGGAPDEPPPPLCDPATGENCGALPPDDEDRACEPNADGSCGEGGDAAPPADPPVYEEGTCVPVSCPAIAMECPPGHHVEIDFSNNPCGDHYCVPDLPPPPPPPPGECVLDADCPDGLVCEIIDECGSACDPSSNEPCPDVCVVIGYCVEREPPPPGCSADADCGTGFVCEQTEVCACAGGGAMPPEEDPPEDGGDGARPAPCMEECTVEGQCVWDSSNVTCYFDGDCGENQRCEYLDTCVVPPDCPNCLMACAGVCVDDEPEPVTCWSDDECGADQVCDRINYCEAAPGCDGDDVACPPVCYGRCVLPDEPPPASDTCLEEGDCAEGFRCATEVDACYCPDGQTCEICYWQCVPEDDAP